MMKSPWQIGLLALAITGVSAYDIIYFTNRAKNQASAPIVEAQPAPAMMNPVLSPLPAPAGSANTEGSAGAGSFPRISREEIQKLSQQVFVSKKPWEPDSETVWPRRDPFEIYKESERISTDNEVILPMQKPPDPAPLTVPQCVFSGTLIESSRRLALVDGTPMSIGDRLGAWQLARIEPDYIILEAGKETRRIELKGTESQIARRKDPS
jgi:hypothetical protein